MLEYRLHQKMSYSNFQLKSVPEVWFVGLKFWFQNNSDKVKLVLWNRSKAGNRYAVFFGDFFALSSTFINLYEQDQNSVHHWIQWCASLTWMITTNPRFRFYFFFWSLFHVASAINTIKNAKLSYFQSILKSNQSKVEAILWDIRNISYNIFIKTSLECDMMNAS